MKVFPSYSSIPITGIYEGWICLHFSKMFFCQESTFSSGTPISGFCGKPFLSFTPITMYPPAPIIQIVSKGANGLQGSFWVPGFLEFNSGPFDHLARQQCFDASWNRHVRLRCRQL